MDRSIVERRIESTATGHSAHTTRLTNVTSSFSFLTPVTLASLVLLKSIKWWLSILGWLAALACWFQIIVVLGLGREEILDYKWKFYVFIFLWIIIICSYFNAMFSVARPIPQQYYVKKSDNEEENSIVVKTECGSTQFIFGWFRYVLIIVRYVVVVSFEWIITVLYYRCVFTTTITNFSYFSYSGHAVSASMSH
ncbi:hypothetical protein KIN20_004306 [Parelaphostrongylus tenuis]|uniref:Uncharacterized protein n=1 Tax=Parelaphostrongylus tenuis TaxID=148309 RepID=A0AAD5MR56_PARTN|nr:hypothetical protein KIN20_004306 [Parelaphostrongylus tenuis]